MLDLSTLFCNFLNKKRDRNPFQFQFSFRHPYLNDIAHGSAFYYIVTESTAEEKKNVAIEKDGDTTVKIDGVVYYNTQKAIPVEPDESVIVNEELLLDGSVTNEKITAYAFINDEQLGNILVCLIDGEWYQFIATERVGQP